MDLPKEDKSEMYLKALDYASENMLDLSNFDDIKKIALEFDPTHTGQKDLEELRYQLQNAAVFLDITSAMNESES
jgi:hypothetical protein